MQKRENCKMLQQATLSAMLWILVFQNLLERIWEPFSYIDEITALIGACLGLYDIVIVRKGRPSKDQLWIGIPLMVFIAVGLAGNLIYRYQPFKSAIIDLYTNLKFFFAIGTGYYLFSSLDEEAIKKTGRWNACVITGILFALFLVDRIFCIWPGQVRYGIFSTMLFYIHPTYLAGVMAFLLVLLTVYYDKKNLPHIAMALTILVFTLRSKSFASAAMYVLVFVWFVVFGRKLRLWHVLAAGAGSIAAGWNMIRFYFIDLSGASARSVILQKSFEVMKDHFPIGSGFGTFGSAEAAKQYSAVYHKYNFNDYWELRDVSNVENTLRLINQDSWLVEQYQKNPDIIVSSSYLSDHFWPIIFGQTGVLGTVAFLLILGVLIKRCLDMQKVDSYAFTGALFILCYLIISSVAEPAFHNSVAIPLALVLGMMFAKTEKVR